MKNFRTKNFKNCRRSQRERGVALIAALFALMLISALAMAMVFSTTTESAVNANFKDSEVAEYAAHAGIQEARERLIATATDYLGVANIPAQPPAPLGGGVVYITNPAQGEAVQPQTFGTTYFDTELCHDNFPLLGLANPGNNVPCATAAPAGAIQPMVASTAPDTNTRSSLNYKWVRLTEKTNISASPNANLNWAVLPSDGVLSNRAVCWDKTQGRQVLLPAGYVNCDQDPIGGTDGLRTVYMLTSLAVTPRGTRRMAQAEVAFDPPISMLAAVESNDNVTINGALTVTGYDNCSCNCITTGAGSNTVVSCTPRAVGGNCNGSKYGIFASGDVQNPTGAAEQVYSGAPQPYVGSHTSPQCGGTGAGCTPFPYNVQDLVNQYSAMPGVMPVTSSPYNWTCSSGNCGTQTSSVFGQSQFPQSPPDNPAGMVPQMTYIPGSVKLTSNATGSGIIIVNGDLEINGGFQFYGLVLVSGSVKFTGGGSAPTNIYGGVLSGTPIVDDTVLGGSANIQYDYCALNNSSKGQPPRTLAMRELSY